MALEMVDSIQRECMNWKTGPSLGSAGTSFTNNGRYLRQWLHDDDESEQ